jgi:hypothetical protein
VFEFPFFQLAKILWRIRWRPLAVFHLNSIIGIIAGNQHALFSGTGSRQRRGRMAQAPPM